MVGGHSRPTSLCKLSNREHDIHKRYCVRKQQLRLNQLHFLEKLSYYYWHQMFIIINTKPQNYCSIYTHTKYYIWQNLHMEKYVFFEYMENGLPHIQVWLTWVKYIHRAVVGPDTVTKIWIKSKMTDSVLWNLVWKHFIILIQIPSTVHMPILTRFCAFILHF